MIVQFHIKIRQSLTNNKEKIWTDNKEKLIIDKRIKERHL